MDGDNDTPPAETMQETSSTGRERERRLIVPAPREKHMSAAGELQEDLHDLAVVAERREELTMEFSEFKKQYEEGAI